MHSSRMRTARSSIRPGGLHQAPPWEQTPPAADPPAADIPRQQAPPWRPAANHAGIPPAMHAEITPPSPVNRILDTRL